jgi:hypothetical protein
MGRKKKRQKQPRTQATGAKSKSRSSTAFMFLGVLLLGLAAGLLFVYARTGTPNSAEPQHFGTGSTSVAEVGQSGNLPPLSSQGKSVYGWHDMANIPKNVRGRPLPKDRPQPDVVVKPGNRYLGSLGRKDIVNLSYILVNDGDRNLVIDNVVTSCGCTTATLSHNIVPPGHRADLAVRFDAGYHAVKPGQQVVRIVWLMTNDPDTPVAEARLTAVIR